MLRWIDEEYNEVKPKSKIDKEIIGISIDGQEYFPGNDGEVCVYIGALKGFMGNELPKKLVIVPAVDFNEQYINQGEFPGDIFYDGKNLVCVVEVRISCDQFSGKFNDDELNTFYEIVEKVQNQKRFANEVYDGNDYKDIEFAFSVSAEVEISSALKNMVSIVNEIYRQNEYNFSEIDEETFTKQYVIGALQKEGMTNVRYSHGVEEYGKDIVYQFKDNFGVTRYGAAQVKKGDISGNARGKISEIIEQIDDAFTMSYNDLMKGQKVKIDQVAVICSGKYTNNAQEKILNKILRGQNIIFLDGQDIINMLER